MNLLFGFLLTIAAATTSTETARVPDATLPPPVDRTAVFLHVDAPDAVGAAYVARVREALSRSSAYRAVSNPADARFIVAIVTMDSNEADTAAEHGKSSSAAVTLQLQNGTALNQFVYSWVLVARPDSVDALARDLVTAIDTQIRELDRTTPQHPHRPSSTLE